MGMMKAQHIEMMAEFNRAIDAIVENVKMETPSDFIADWEECAMCGDSIFPGSHICDVCDTMLDSAAEMETERANVN